MGDFKLCLLLLLSTSTLAHAQNGDDTTCFLDKRYKTLHKYKYRYEAESLNTINGASRLKNGPKAACTVEIEVPQTCSFVVRTTGCSLSEAVGMDEAGNPIFSSASTSDRFAAEMERYPLKVAVEGWTDVKLYPEVGETTTTLNFKRGIISALAVPLLEEEQNKKLPTIHGVCNTHYTINAREDIATDITLTRDLNKCDNFFPMRAHTSPLALISGMHYPLTQLVRSSQTCNYKFDNEKKHMTSGLCIENHIFIPFSHKGEYGITTVGKQELTLQKVSAHNDRVFEHGNTVMDLHMEPVEDKSVVQDKGPYLDLLRKLATLPESEGEKRAHLFHHLVTMVRGMKAETLSLAIPEALEVSRVLMYQVDATVYAMGLVANPSALLIHDMLEMAKYKPSKSIMYALSNMVKRFYEAEGKVVPEIHSVAEFMTGQLGDCSGEEDHTFMTLRVIGNMAPAMFAVSPALRAAVLKCVNHPDASRAVQQAAIQVYRLTSVPEEGREVLLQVLLDSTRPLQMRIAAYLVLMKDPNPKELAQVADALSKEEDKQVKSFVMSHISNILTSNDPETKILRQYILEVLQDNEIGPITDPTKFSRYYKIGSLEGNMIFESTDYLPKEAMLEMTLRAFGYDIDMMEIGIEGNGFEPTVEALFGPDGFFPHTALESMFFISDNLPVRVSEVVHNTFPALKKYNMKKQVTKNLMREIRDNFNNVMKELETNQSPEAKVYLRLLGNELGYLRTNDIEEMASSAAMMIDSMFNMFSFMKGWMTKTDNTMFAHYIFMDNEFFLPTVTGVPLRIALSGTITPGIKGGFHLARDMTEASFMPSVGIEFVTQIGSHIPEYVNSGLEMHTNIFHESGLSAKIALGRDNIKLTIPAPKSPTKLLKMTNTLVAVTGSEVKTIPPMVQEKIDVSECTPFFSGMKYCRALQYTDAFNEDTSPYFPLTGDSKFVVELHPTGEVTEYTVTVAYELLKEGEEGRQKVDSVQLILRAEGTTSAEARAIMKYNRKTHVVTADVQIPDYDIEAGIRLGAVDGNTKGKGTHSVSLDFINKNIPQLSLVGRAKLKDTKEGMLQVQLLVPSINTDATLTANMKLDEESKLELKSDIKFMGVSSEQKIALEYDINKIGVELKSDMNIDTGSIFPSSGVVKSYGNKFLNMRVGNTDMKVRRVFKKIAEAANNYVKKYAADMPYLQKVRIPELPDISLPEKLFLNTEVKTIYHFNDEHFSIDIPLILGGKSRDQLNFPPTLTTPHVSMLPFGLEFVSMDIPIPEFVIPESLTLSVPLFGKAEVSVAMKSNLYDLDATVAAGKDVKTPTYSAKVDFKGSSPIDIFSVKFEGSGAVTTVDSIKATLQSTLKHKLIEASLSIVNNATITDRLNVRSSGKFEATNPFGLSIIVQHNVVTGLNTEEISVDGNFDGTIKAGYIYGNVIATQSFSVFPFKPEAKIDSFLQFDSTVGMAKNTLVATFVNGELSVHSDSNVFEDTVTHVFELSFKDSMMSLKCDANLHALGMKISNHAEASAGAGEVIVNIETNADHSGNHGHSLLTGSLDVNGLTLNSNASMKISEIEATHKATLKMNKDGLVSSGTTSLQSLLLVGTASENTFTAVVNASTATLFISNKAAIDIIEVDNVNTLTLTLASLDFTSKAKAAVSYHSFYIHDVIINLKPYTASANVNSNLKILNARVNNEVQLNAEPYKLDMIGSTRFRFGNMDIKNTYQANYANLTAYAKFSTNGNLFGSQISRDTEIEVVGLSALITNDVRFISTLLRFNHTTHCSIVPFDFNLDVTFSSDGNMAVYGKQSGQLYGKFQLRAQPLAFASLHEHSASMSLQLDNVFSMELTMHNKIDIILLPQEQKASFRTKSKMNDHTFNQDISVYHTAERAGIEVSGTILTCLLNPYSPVKQESSITGFLKYDKNMDFHVIHLPLIENVPVAMENIKAFVVYVAEALQNYINSEDFSAKLDAVLHYLNDIFTEIHLEARVIELKQHLKDFTQDYVISKEEVEKSLINLRLAILHHLTFYTERLVNIIKDNVISGTLPETIVHNVQQLLNAINEDYGIKDTVVSVIESIVEIIKQTDLEKLRGSSYEFLHDIEVNFRIKATLLAFMRDLKYSVERFDIEKFATSLKREILVLGRFILRDYYKIATKFLDFVTDNIRDLIHEFDIVPKINILHVKMRELNVKFEFDKRAEAILDKATKLITEFRIEETIGAVAKILNDIDIPHKIIQALQGTIKFLKSIETTNAIQQLNACLDTLVQNLKAFNYNDFVAQANQMILEYTAYLNEIIKTLEIPQKLDATREFASTVLSYFRGFTEELREIKVSEMMKTVQDIVDLVVVSNIKTFGAIITKEIRQVDVNHEIITFLQMVNQIYRITLSIIFGIVDEIIRDIRRKVPGQKIINEIKQMLRGIETQLKRGELNITSFTVPLTDLVVPSTQIRMYKVRDLEIPTQLDIPEFTVLGFHTVHAISISIDDIKETVIKFIDFIVNIDIKLLDMDAAFGELTLNYLPSMPEITLPKITLPDVSFPTIPQVPVEKLVRTLELPEINLPAIPSQLVVPCFGKLYGSLQFHTPIYTIKSSVEFRNATENKITPKFTGFVTSQGTFTLFPFHNYKLESTVRLAFPKKSRVVIAESLKLTHSALGVEHNASVILYGWSAQGHAKTVVKVITEPYTADFINSAFIAMEGGMSASLDTTYIHIINVPVSDFPSEAVLTQKAVILQKGYTLSATVDNACNGKINEENANHKSKLQLSLSPMTATLTFSGDTDSAVLTMNQQISMETVTFSSAKFNIRNEAAASIIKNSLLVASGYASLFDQKAEINVTHDTELYGAVSGYLSNKLCIVAQPQELVFDFHNTGNAKADLFDTVAAKIELQNDYSANFNPDNQQVSVTMLARFNQYKMCYNFTAYNNEKEAGSFFIMENEANLDFLTSISIPEIELSSIGFYTPAINDLNLYEQTPLKDILTTTDQTINVDTKIIYKKSQTPPVVAWMGLVLIPSLGNVITELSFKSTIINLNVNAVLHAEDDLVFRLGATSTSVFEGLKAKLNAITSLSTKSGMKLANSLSLENHYIEGIHENTINTSPATVDRAITMATVAKITLPVLSLEANQTLFVDTKTKANAVSTLKMKGDFNIPVIRAVGKAEADHILKLERTFKYVSVASATKASVDGTVIENYAIVGVLDNEVDIYINDDGFRSTSKVITDAKLSQGTAKIVAVGVNKNLAVEASNSRVYGVLNFTSNNEASLFALNTTGKHVVQATIGFTPYTSLNADVEIDLSQPSSLCDLNIFEKTVVELTATKQKISSNVKYVSPLYTTNLEVQMEGSVPVYKATLQSSATSIIAFLEYNLQASTTTAFENEALNISSTAVLTHSDFALDINHVITQALRSEHLIDDSVSRHVVNMDITSPIFTDIKLCYAAQRDEVSASIASPSSGVLGFQLNSGVPSHTSARIYSRYATSPDVDVDILNIRPSSKDTDDIQLQIAYNMDAPKVMLAEVKKKIPSITAAFASFADKYHITQTIDGLKSCIVTRLNEAYKTAFHYDTELSQLSVFFRSVIVEGQKTVQVVLDDVVKFLQETHFKLTGFDEMATLPELQRKLLDSVANALIKILRAIFHNIEIYSNRLGEMINNVELFEVVISLLKGIADILIDFVKDMDTFDTMLKNIGSALNDVVDTAQAYVDSTDYEFINDAFVDINGIYRVLIFDIRKVVLEIADLTVEDLNNAFDHILEKLLHAFERFKMDVSTFLRQDSPDPKQCVKVNDGRLEINLPCRFRQ